MRGPGRRAGRSALLAVTVALAVGTAGYAAPARSAALTSGVAAVPSAVTAAGITISVSAVTPAVAQHGQVVTVTGTIHNASGTPVAVPRVRLVRGTASVASRAAVTAWATSGTPATGAVLGSVRLDPPIPGGGDAAYRIRVRGVSDLGAATWGVLPISVEAGTAVVHTFLGYQRVKEYEPLRTAWLVPLTLDPDPALWEEPGTAREKAWRMTLGQNSRLDRLIVATEAAPVTWAVDPRLLQAATLPASAVSPSPNPSPSPTPTGPSQAMASGPEEATLRTDMATRLAGLAGQHGPIVLPTADADVAAASALPDYAPSIADLVRSGAAAAADVGGRADIAWPAGGTWTARTEKAITGLYGATPAGVVVPRSALPGLDPAIAGTVRTRAGTPLLVAEDSATDPAAQAMGDEPRHGVGAATQQLVATTAVVLGERPGVSRDLLLTLPRGAEVSVNDATTLFATLSTVPWLTSTTVADVAADAAKADRTSTGGGRLGPAATPLLQAPERDYADLRSSATVGAQIRSDGATVGPRWGAALDELLSAQWRGNPTQWRDLYDDVTREVQRTTRAVHVAPQTITFLADRGRVQVTVVNDLDVEVDHLTVELIPDNPRLRIDSPPKAVRIGPHSRTTIAFDATALAAGQVRLTARILGPTGVEVGRETVVQVTVSPTGSWIFWGLGALAALAFALGTVRNLRRRGTAGAGAEVGLVPAGSAPGGTEDPS